MLSLIHIFPVSNEDSFEYSKYIAKEEGLSLIHISSEYKVIEILQLIEGNLAPVACLCEGGKKCESTAECTTLPFWQGLENVINDYLEKHTLEDMISQKTHSCES